MQKKVLWKLVFNRGTVKFRQIEEAQPLWGWPGHFTSMLHLCYRVQWLVECHHLFVLTSFIVTLLVNLEMFNQKKS